MSHESLSDSELKRAFDNVVAATPELHPEVQKRFAADALQHQMRSLPGASAAWHFAGGAGLIAATAVGFWIGTVPLASLAPFAPDENAVFWQAEESGVISALKPNSEWGNDNG